MKKILMALALFICFIQMSHSQEEDGVVSFALPIRNSLTFNQYAINPTFSFVRQQNKYISITNKREWVQFDDAPQTYLASFSGRFSENSGMGIGLFQQNYGVLTTFGGIVNFAYNARLARDSNLTFGLNVGAYKSGINSGNVVTNFPDPSLENIPSNFLLTINPGINYGTGFMDFGVSVNNLALFNTSELIEDNPEQSIQGHVMYTGYVYSNGFFDESRFTGLARSEFKKDNTVISGNLMLMVPKGIWAQVGYNNLYGASGGLGINITKQIAIEYNFEKALGDLTDFGPSHEITLAYKFNNKDNYDYSREDDVSALISKDNRRKPVSKASKLESDTNRQLSAQAKAEAKLAAEAKALADAEAKTKADEKAKVDAKAAKLAAENKAKEDIEAKAKSEAIAKAKADADAIKLAAEAEAKIKEEKLAADIRAKEVAEAKAKIAAENKAKIEAKLAAEAKAKLDAEAKSKAEALTKLEAETKLKAEAKAKADAEIARIAEEERIKTERLAQIELEAKNKAKVDEKAKAEAEATRLAQEVALKTEAAQLKLAEENRVKAEAKAKADAEIAEEARIKTEQLAQIELEAKNKAKAKADAEKAATEVAKPKDDIAVSMGSIEKLAEDSRLNQQELLSRFSEAVANKDKDLKELKEENDLSDKGIVSEPKPFKSVTAENETIEALKLDLDIAIKTNNDRIRTLETLYEQRQNIATMQNDTVNLYYQKAIKRLNAEQLTAIQTRANLSSNLENIKEATEIERKRRIKRAAYDNEQDKYNQDRATLRMIKQNTKLSTVPLKTEDFDTGEEQSGNIQILKNIKNVESGYYTIVAVHDEVAKRDEFLTKAIASGRTDIDFFYDVSTSKYYIYYEKFDNIEAANESLKLKGSRPYNEKLSIVKIEN